jgi:broad specificity phosphatase PhoE
VPLSREGRAQARLLAERLRAVPLEAVYASDLQRAVETARAVAEPHGLDVKADARLREFDFGAWEGLTWPEIVSTRPHLQERNLTAAALYAPEGGETFAAVCERVRSFFEELRRQPFAHAAVVMHAGPLHAALDVLEVARPDGSSFATASLTQVAMEAGRARLITLSDVRHLHPAG